MELSGLGPRRARELGADCDVESSQRLRVEGHLGAPRVRAGVGHMQL